MILAAPLLWCATAGLAQDDNGLMPFDNNHKQMNAAIAAAQQSLPLFLCAAVDAEGYGPEGGFLKVRVPVKAPDMTDEVIWVGPFAAWDAKNFAGLLANEPIAMPGFALGDQLDFTYDMIVDWSWSHPSGAEYGHYTTRVIFDQIGDSAALAALADPAFDDSWSCTPANS